MQVFWKILSTSVKQKYCQTFSYSAPGIQVVKFVFTAFS